MILFPHPSCVEYGSSPRPEPPAPLTRSVAHLKKVYPEWVARETKEGDQLADFAEVGFRSGLPRLIDDCFLAWETPTPLST